MAKLFLKFEQAVLKEIPLSQGVTTIGRLPDNVLQIDNLAVSGHHAKIYWDTDKFIIEDNNSLNGTYVNSVRISRHPLRDGDNVLIGRHTLAFKDEQPQGWSAPAAGAETPKVGSTFMMDSKKAKEMLPGMASQPAAPARAQAAPSLLGQFSATPPADKVRTLTVVSGKTEQAEYLLTSKMNVIGKSDMASIKLKGWFAPKMAALISKRENGYFIAASEKKIKVKVNDEEIAGQRALAEGDLIEVAGTKMAFGFQE